MYIIPIDVTQKRMGLVRVFSGMSVFFAITILNLIGQKVFINFAQQQICPIWHSSSNCNSIYIKAFVSICCFSHSNTFKFFALITILNPLLHCCGCLTMAPICGLPQTLDTRHTGISNVFVCVILRLRFSLDIRSYPKILPCHDSGPVHKVRSMMAWFAKFRVEVHRTCREPWSKLHCMPFGTNWNTDCASDFLVGH